MACCWRAHRLVEVVGGAVDVEVDLPAGEVVVDVAERLLLGACAKAEIILGQVPLVVIEGVLHVACTDPREVTLLTRGI